MACMLYTEDTSTTKSGKTVAIRLRLNVLNLVYSLAMQKQHKPGDLHVKVVNKGTGLKEVNTCALYGIVSIGGQC
jgi:hypothetical protein